MKILFWFSFVMIIYTYAGYPLAIWLASRLRPRPVRKAPFEPTVTVILSAFNEENHIEKKLGSLLKLDYPDNKLSILIGSDGSTDRTNAIAAPFQSQRITLVVFSENHGKPYVLNELVKQAKGDILLFTDARQEMDPGAVRALTQNFSDPDVGCVSGELLFYEGTQDAIGKGMGAYWDYEKFLRKRESEAGCMLGATGAIYAIRRQLYTPIPLDMLVDDMYLPLAIADRGYRAVFETGARVYDRASSRGKQEFKRKVRTLAGNYQIFQTFPRLFHPGKSQIAFQIFSHKFLRLVVPFFLMGLLVSNLFILDSGFFYLMLLLQAAFYTLALVESFHEKTEPGSKRGPLKKVGHIAYTFCLLNYAAFAALFEFVKGNPKSVWKKAYE